MVIQLIRDEAQDFLRQIQRARSDEVSIVLKRLVCFYLYNELDTSVLPNDDKVFEVPPK